MTYLDKTVAEMKGKIMVVYGHLKSAQTEEDAGKQMDKLERYIRGKLIESFKNGIELGSKKRGSGR